MQNKSGGVLDALSYDIKEKGLAPIIRDLRGLEIKIIYLLNHKHFVINYGIRNVDLNNVYLYISNLGSYVT